jgi:hypothetical protein
VTEILSLAVTIFLVWTCVWLLGGAESFTMMWERQSGSKEESENQINEGKSITERIRKLREGGKGKRLDRLKDRVAGINDKVFSEPRKRINGLFRRGRGQRGYEGV